MNLKSILEKSRKYPPEIMVKKAVRKSLTLVQSYFRYINDIILGTKLTDNALKEKLLSPKIEEIQFSLSWRPLLPNELKDKIIEEADKARNHIFNLLGSGDIKVDYKLKAGGLDGYRYDMRLSDKKYLSIKKKIQAELEEIFQKPIEYETIDWQVDFKSGYRWSEKTYYKFIKYGHKLGADVKLPWELSRAQHLLSLALSYRLTKKEEYAEEIIEQIVDWILTNPCRFGVNWRCTMDVAIRVANWVVAVSLIKNYIDNLPPAGEEHFCKIFYKSLYQHGEFIIHNLEWSEYLTSNHYLSDIAGLLVLSVFTEDVFKEARQWKKFAIDELKKEILKQVYPDGTDFEASTCYHRLVLEIFFYPVWWVVVHHRHFNGENHRDLTEELFGKRFVNRLYKMFDAVLYLLKPNGRMPQIGDNDNGQFLKLYPREVLDMRYLLALGAIFFKESRWKIKEFFESDESIAEIMILYGESGIEIWNSLEWNSLKNISSKIFNDSGWYVMRNNKDYCIISCGPNGQKGIGGHCHNDKLSFELCINGMDVIVDPGTYVYTPIPKLRDRFRSVKSHNTVIIDGIEHNRYKGVFSMDYNSKTKIVKFEKNDSVDIFIGENRYGENDDMIIHRREIKLYKKGGGVEVIDSFVGEGRHKLEWNLIFSTYFNGEFELESKDLKWIEKFTFYSSEYGRKCETLKYYSKREVEFPGSMKFYIKFS